MGIHEPIWGESRGKYGLNMTVEDHGSLSCSQIPDASDSIKASEERFQNLATVN
jgi:hypothetical protein